MHSHYSPAQNGHTVVEAVTGLLQEDEEDGEAVWGLSMSSPRSRIS